MVRLDSPINDSKTHSRTILFDLAVNRTVVYALRLGTLKNSADRDLLAGTLELWFLRTRFASKIHFNQVIEVLLTWTSEAHYWAGGYYGSWLPKLGKST